MKKKDVSIGKVYLVTVSGKRARVRLTGESPHGGWTGVNIDTKRKVRVKTAGRLQREIADPDAAPPAPKADSQPETPEAPQEPTPPAPEAQETAEEAPEPAETSDQQAAPATEAEATGDQPEGTESETQRDEAPSTDEPEAAPAADEPEGATTTDGDQSAGGDAAAEETPLTKLTVPELQALYRKVIQRDTSSTNKAYLVWKLREAKKGRIPIGPRRQRTPGDSGSAKVLPLRMDAEAVARLDEARERLGLPSRMDLFRRALHTYLDNQGETDVAALFAPEA